jgi:leader peptidase (prepilin peptidase)/N-methyltransferase
MTLLWITISPQYFLVYFIFFSGLIVTVRTDLEYMLICRAATWGLIPVACVAALLDVLSLSLLMSVLGAGFGYGVLWLVAKLFFWRTQREGLGQGDLELLACIGAFTGITGAWLSLVIASITGLLAGLIYVIATHNIRAIRLVKLPFGPFLALGAMAYVLAAPILERLFLGL